MAEFGENIRRAREALGVTQQTLADQLYVTRQAVSRWENGSRYPDLLTANKLAASLDTTLDNLLRDDDMHTYPEVNPVIEYPLTKRVQTAIFAAAFAINLILLLWDIFYNLTDFRAFSTAYETAWQITGAIMYVLTATVLFYGVLRAIKDAVTPRTAAGIMIFIVGLDGISRVILCYLSWRNLTPVKAPVVIETIAIDAVFILSVIWFFYSKKLHRPISIYILTGLEIAFTLISYVGNLIPVIGTADLRKYLTNATLSTLGALMVEILFIYMTAVLYRKRRLTKN